MFTFLVVVHVFVGLALILIVLLQTGKGASIGATFGAGGSNTLFGAQGPQSFLGKVTAGAAVIFMITSLSLAVLSSKRGASTVIPEGASSVSADLPKNEPGSSTSTDGVGK
ncbi:MAG: preprotein translocase subunit SecG [Nitrospinota bacterium]